MEPDEQTTTEPKLEEAPITVGIDASIKQPLQDNQSYCDSCGKPSMLFDTPHQQDGNTMMWHYCEWCKALHDKEALILNKLKELLATHPQAVNSSQVLTLLNQGQTVEEVKKQLDLASQPVLEAEVAG